MHTRTEIYRVRFSNALKDQHTVEVLIQLNLIMEEVFLPQHFHHNLLPFLNMDDNRVRICLAETHGIQVITDLLQLFISLSKF